MKYLKSYKIFSESLSYDILGLKVDLLESLSIWYDDLLSSMEKIDLFDKFQLPAEDFSIKTTIDELVNRTNFINALTSLKLKKGVVENTDDSQTFINKPCKFMFIYGNEASELETVPDPPTNPIYLLFQTWNGEEWSDIELYEPKEDIKKFYDKLSSRKIQIVDGEKKFQYETSNGNEWELSDKNQKDDTYQEIFRKDELEKVISERNAKLIII